MSRKSRKSRKSGGYVDETFVSQPAPTSSAKAPAAPPAAPKVGGRRKTRRVSKGASDWNKKVMEVYRELKKKNPATKLGDAMRECSKRKKRGDL